MGVVINALSIRLKLSKPQNESHTNKDNKPPKKVVISTYLVFVASRSIVQ